MKIPFTPLQKITNALMLNVSSIEDIGVQHGKMGAVLYFYHLSRSTGERFFAEFAENLLDDVTGSLTTEMGVDFRSGITGIGYMVEHLIQNGFIDANADEVLEEIDQRSKNQLCYGDNSLENVISIAHYFVSRLRYRVDDEDNMTVVNLKYCTIILLDELERLLLDGQCSQHTAFVLSELHKLNIFNYKVEKLQRMVGGSDQTYLFPFVGTKSQVEIERILTLMEPFSENGLYGLDALPTKERFGLRSGLAGVGLQLINNSHEL